MAQAGGSKLGGGGRGPVAAYGSVPSDRTPSGGGWRSALEPLMIIVIGLALGLVDQTSSEVSGMLRIPALVAALILVGQGLSMLEEARAAATVQAIPTATREGVGPAGRAEPPIITAGEEVTEAPRTSSRAYLVLFLAIWLGVATLVYPTAPISLILLSLLSAYLLFARGWRTMQAPQG
jgi:hypothetical protein